ncbi:MAG: SH3 domain-containing protein [Planctomycetaceae bacterium]
MRRKLFLTSVVLCLTAAVSAEAQISQFPYKARVVEDGAYVRSGVVNGEPYYPTQRLAKDAVVTVLRHDPGGWYQIEPPEGSFSWVAEEYIRLTTSGHGEVAENSIVAFVGSEFGDETSVWQRLLRSGEEVTILGKKLVDTADGPKSMLKIVPPTREYRWIAGSAVVPVGDGVRQQHDSDPFRVPSNARRPSGSDPISVPDGDVPPIGHQDAAAVRPSPQLARLQQIRSQQQELREIDDRFRSMLLDEPSNWDLDEIESAYRNLQNETSHKPLAGQIDLRFPAIERYRRRHAEYVDFKRLTSQTEQRDAQLLASQYGLGGATAMSNTGDLTASDFDGERISLADATSPTSGIVSDSPAQPSLQPHPDANFLQLRSAEPIADSNTDLQLPSLNIPASSRYIGAGILQRSAASEGETQYVLATPSGRVLAHVAQKGDVDLESYVGQSVGLYGSRQYRSDLKSDFIEASGLEAVKIRR